MKATIENLQFYVDLLNAQGSVKIKLYRANGTNYLNRVLDNETIFNGTINECYYFLLGAQKLVNPTFNDYTVNGTLRTFMIVDSRCINYFCNLSQISRVIEQNSLRAGYYTIYEFRNNKQKNAAKNI